MSGELFDALADRFADGAYATVKGQVRTYVMHRQLLEHLPAAPASVLDAGGGTGHQSFPLAEAGYEVTLLDPSEAMLAKARERLARLTAEAQQRVTLVRGDGERAYAALGRRYDAVLCHGVLGYLERPDTMVAELCRCTAPGGVLSIMTGNARAMAVRPALEQRWEDALAAFDSRSELGVLGAETRADTVEELQALLRQHSLEPEAWYGVWLFADWLEFAGAATDPGDREAVARMAEAEYEAARRDPYRAMSRVFHLVGRAPTG